VFQRLLIIIALRPDRFINAIIIACMNEELIGFDNVMFFKSLPTSVQTSISNPSHISSNTLGVNILPSFYFYCGTASLKTLFEGSIINYSYLNTLSTEDSNSLDFEKKKKIRIKLYDNNVGHKSKFIYDRSNRRKT
jgi:hypothetical protein